MNPNDSSLKKTLTSTQIKHIKQKLISCFEKNESKSSRTLEEVQKEIESTIIKIHDDYFGDELETIKKLMPQVGFLFNFTTSENRYLSIYIFTYKKTTHSFFKNDFIISDGLFNKLQALVSEESVLAHNQRLNSRYLSKIITKYLEACTTIREVEEDFPDVDFSSIKAKRLNANAINLRQHYYNQIMNLTR